MLAIGAVQTGVRTGQDAVYFAFLALSSKKLTEGVDARATHASGRDQIVIVWLQVSSQPKRQLTIKSVRQYSQISLDSGTAAMETTSTQSASSSVQLDIASVLAVQQENVVVKLWNQKLDRFKLY